MTNKALRDLLATFPDDLEVMIEVHGTDSDRYTGPDDEDLYEKCPVELEKGGTYTRAVPFNPTKRESYTIEPYLRLKYRDY